MNKTYIWWKFLCITAVLNIAAWLWALSVYSQMPNFSYIQPVLSGLYVVVCAFRSFFPRIDLERYCLIDSPWSSIVLGRSLATIAEICFSIQCALIIHQLGIYLEVSFIVLISYLLVPIIVVAQVSCWYAALTLNHFWHGIEEVMWVIMIVLAAGCFITGYVLLDGWLQLLMVLGLISCIGAAWIMLFVDIPMYFSRQDEEARNGQRYLAIVEGARDAWERRIQTSEWAVWKQEVVWISSYFTFGVWLSIGMIFIEF